VTPDPEFASFARLIDSLSPWLDQVVIIGGWAHRLYRFHPSAQRLDYPSLSTLDTDVAVPARIAVKEQDIHERLIAHGLPRLLPVTWPLSERRFVSTATALIGTVEPFGRSTDSNVIAILPCASALLMRPIARLPAGRAVLPSRSLATSTQRR
jgi:hypothetical protein